MAMNLRRLTERVRGLVNGQTPFPLSAFSRKQFRYLSCFFPPIFYPGFLERTAGLFLVLRAVKKHSVEGDLVECGVGMGGSLFVLGTFMKHLEMGRRLYGLDSFMGFPDPSTEDESPRKPVRGDLWARTSASHVAKHFEDGGLGDFFASCVRLLPGFFEATIPTLSEPRQIAFLHLDVDLHDSYRDCLEGLGPRVTGLILYDEYNSPKWPGATKAIDTGLPKLGHSLFYSRLMKRYFSLPERIQSSAFARELVEELDAQSARRS